MFKLKKLNVIKIVDSEYKKNRLIAEGYKLVEEKKKSNKEVKDDNGGAEK